MITIETEAKEKPRFVIINGNPKIGKTTFALHSDSPVLIAIGNETGHEVMKAPKITNHDNSDPIEFVNEAIRYLIKENHGYKTAIFDNLFQMKEIINAQVIKENPTVTKDDKQVKVTDISQYPWGTGAGLTKPYWDKFITGITLLRERKGMHIALLSQPEKKTIKPALDQSYEILGLSVPASRGCDIHTQFTSIADVILHMQKDVATKSVKAFIGTKKVATQGNTVTYVYTTEGQGGFVCGNRLGLSPYYEVEESESSRALMHEFNNPTYKQIWADIYK